MIYARKNNGKKTTKETKERENFRNQEIKVTINIEKDITRNILRNNNNNNNNYYYLLQLGCNPVAVVMLHVYKT